MKSSCCCFSHSALSAGLICVTCALSSSNSVLSRSIVVQLEPKNARTSSANSVPRVFIRTHLLSSSICASRTQSMYLGVDTVQETEIRGVISKRTYPSLGVPDHHRGFAVSTICILRIFNHDNLFLIKSCPESRRKNRRRFVESLFE